ncbi:MAG: Tex family protein [bacterium]
MKQQTKNFTTNIASELQLSETQVQQTLTLLKDGGTIPFIARYRKEMTGELDEVQIAAIQKRADEMIALEERRNNILISIEKQGKLTPELKADINAALTLAKLEDLYLPYKVKKLTRATKAKNKGLEPFAKIIFTQTDIDLPAEAKKYLNKSTDKEKAVKTVADALQGARDIIAEWINEDQEARSEIREIFANTATINSQVKKSKKTEAIKYQDYFDFSEELNKIPSHRLLAVRRGEKEGFFNVNILPDQAQIAKALIKLFIKSSNESSAQVELAMADAYDRLLSNSIETEFANLSKKQADTDAINVFAINLKQLLLEAPLGQKSIIALDPGFRTGCKIAVLDQQGNFIVNTVIHPESSKAQAILVINKLAEKFKTEAFAIGDGTASRETEAFIKELGLKLPIYMVNEDGASVYSASENARNEFPDLDITVRGAISIGRRLMDPLAELVKIDPKAIGVGQYQHDVDQKLLKVELDQTVISCVNLIGVNLNTASKHILTYISGLNSQLAQNIIDYRNEKGLFTKRQQLLKVKKLGKKTFEQCAGFLRIQGAKNPLDNSSVHPESYQIVEQIAKDQQKTIKDLIGNEILLKQIQLKKYITETIGLPTLEDIVTELQKPAHDPRGVVATFAFNSEIKEITDLTVDMTLPGIVTNITNFGAFVDLGLHTDGLIHISNMADHFISHPSEVLVLHQKVEVKVLEIDLERKRIGLKLMK